MHLLALRAASIVDRKCPNAGSVALEELPGNNRIPSLFISREAAAGFQEPLTLEWSKMLDAEMRNQPNGGAQPDRRSQPRKSECET